MEDNRDDNFDFREVKDEELNNKDTNDNTSDNSTGENSDNNNNNANNDNNDKPEFEDVCFVCRRPESKAGKMFHLPNNICICEDCMRKTMDTVTQFDYQNLLNNPNLMGELNKNMGTFPNVGFFSP